MDQSPAAEARRLAHRKQELILAVRADDRDTIESLLVKGVPVNTRNNEGESLLHGAAQDGHVATMKLLIRRGCKVDVVDARGLTPLHSAAAQGQTKAVRELIRNGASKSEVASIFGTPLHQAASKGHVETVLAMLEEGCPLDVVNSAGSTVLHWAAEGGHVELVRELVGRGCDVNAVRADGCTPLHFAAAHGRTEVVRELIKLGATRLAVATTFGTPIDQAHLKGQVETVEAMSEDEVCDVRLNRYDGTYLKPLQPECNVIGTSASFGVTPVMSALLFGKVDMLKLLISKGGTIRDRDIYSLSTFEHCFVGGHASELQQLCEACGIGSSGTGLKGALATLINQGLVDARKVLCLCAISGDSVLLEDQFIELFSHDPSAMPAALECAKFYFFKGVGFLNQLKLRDEDVLNPLHLSLLSFKCYEMGYATRSVELGAKDHTSFITSLLSHPVLKKTVHENFPNGLSPLDIAQRFGLHQIAALIAEAGGDPGVWAGAPQEIQIKHHLAVSRLKDAYASMKAIAEDGEYGNKFIKGVFSSVIRPQTVESEVQTESLLAKEQDSLWHPNAAIVGAVVGPETDEHEYKSLMVPADKSKKPPPMRPCKDTSEVLEKVANHSKEINAMLNHHTGGTVHFGSQDKHKTVEEGLDLPQAAVVDKLQTRVSQLLQEFYPSVYSHFVTVQPVHLLNSTGEPTGRWRFDICVSPHVRLVLHSRKQTVAYYRQGGNSVPMLADLLIERLKDAS